MTQEDKLRNFYDLSIESAKQQSNRMLSEYRAALDADFEEHRSEKESAAAERMKTETTALRRELKRELSDRQNEMRRNLADSQKAVKDKIFANAADKLTSFRGTAGYQTWLFRNVEAVKEFAGEDAVTLYIDPEDAAYTNEIEAACGIVPVISRESFGGGIRAVIRSRKILIDNSFNTLLAEEKEKFKFDGGKQ